jgi:hypothetical protein
LLLQVEAGWSTLMMMESAGSDSGTPSSPVSLVACRMMGLDEDAEAAVEELAAAQREQQLAEQFMADMDAEAAAAADAAADEMMSQQQQGDVRQAAS